MSSRVTLVVNRRKRDGPHISGINSATSYTVGLTVRLRSFEDSEKEADFSTLDWCGLT